MKKQLFTLFTAASLFSLTLAPFSLHAQVPNYVPTNGLVGWWPFNGNANDESGNGNNGTVNGATLTADRFGNVNKAYGFDGVDDFIETNNINFGGQTHYTISLWYNINTALAVGSPQHYLFFHGSISNPLYLNVDEEQIQFPCIQLQTQSSLNTWSNFILVKMDQVFNLYHDGQLITSSNSCSNNFSNNYPIRIGSTVLNSEFTSGKIDDIGIWNRALTECEIQQLYNAAIPSSTQTQTALNAYTWPVNGQTYTQSGTYIDTLINAAGCDSIVTLNLTMSYTGIEELNPTANKQLVKITDLNGKETPFRKNTVLLFIYDDGTVERVYETE